MPDAPQIAFVGKPDTLSQRITAGGASGTAALSGEGRDLRLVVDGRARHLAYRSARPLPDGGYEALAEDENVHVETTITPGDGFLSVVSRLTALRPLRLSGFEHAYHAFDLGRRDNPAHLWLPLIPGKAGHALAPDALGTPCIALQSEGRLAALLGDVDALEGDQPFPPILAYERPATLRAGYAAGRAAAPGLLERRPAEGTLLPDHDVATLSFLIVLSGEAEPHAGLGRVLRVAWSRFGSSRLDDLALQTLPLDDYARYAYDAAFDRYGLWRDVFIEEGPAGAFAVAAPHREPREGAAPPSPRRPWPTRLRSALARHVPWRERASLLRASADRALNHLHFGAGANALRTAYGMAHFAERWGDEKLMGAAREIVRLALAAPESKGLFPAVYTGAPDRPAWATGARGTRLDDRYGVADLSESGLWMIRLAGDLGLDEAMLDR
ncbi:MAG: hypothetical protein Q8R92_03290, partial [Deltaproteobacteria bacterium]|nr:hypothetical protein [Deltaproteobacteria bacterium]